jgi:putative effector of murein hydrolase LrgA (UPF0299 family)
MALDKLVRNSLNLGLHAIIMGLLIIPLLWVSGGLTPRQEEPSQPLLESNLPFMLTPASAQ